MTILESLAVSDGDKRLPASEVFGPVGKVGDRIERQAEIATGLSTNGEGQFLCQRLRIAPDLVDALWMTSKSTQSAQRGLSIADNAFGKAVGVSFLQTISHHSTREVFAHRDRLLFFSQEIANRSLYRLFIGGKDMFTDQLPYFGFYWCDQLQRDFFGRCFGSDTNIDLPRVSKDANRGILGVGNEMPHEVIHAALSQFSNLEDTVRDDLRERKLPAQIRGDFVIEQPLQFKWYSWENENTSPWVFDDEGRRCAIGVVHRNRTFGHICLPLIIGGHDKPAVAEAMLDLFKERFMEDQFAPRDFGNRLTGQIILRRAKTSAGDDHIGALQCTS